MVTDGEHPLTPWGWHHKQPGALAPKPPPSLTFLLPAHSREKKQPPESQEFGKRSRRDSRGHPKLSHSP